MFKNSAEFAQALLNGREFRDTTGLKCCLDLTKENPFRWGHEGINGSWCIYNQATEIFPKPKPWAPKKGDLIEVWDCDRLQEATYKATFIGVCEGLFVVQAPTEEESYEVWLYAAPVKPTNPWIKRPPNTWPAVKPDQMIEVQTTIVDLITRIATNFDWTSTDIIKYRLIDD